jgi:hypothetical protein
MSATGGALSEVQQRLQTLRPLLQTQTPPHYLRLFDEFIREHEFGLALHSLCDSLLDPNSPTPDESTLAQIKELHQLMKIQDNCLKKLQQRTGVD